MDGAGVARGTASAAAEGGGEGDSAARDRDAPPVPVYHASGQSHIMPRLLQASTPQQLLQLFEDECRALQRPEDFGWLNAKEAITRIGKQVARGGRRAAAAWDAADARWAALCEVPRTAILQGVMDSRTRNGYESDDLTAILAALKAMGQQDAPLYAVLDAKIKEERGDDDDREPGDAGDDFQGGSVGF